jgi:hypothetical protein
MLRAFERCRGFARHEQSCPARIRDSELVRTFLLMIEQVTKLRNLVETIVAGDKGINAGEVGAVLTN